MSWSKARRIEMHRHGGSHYYENFITLYQHSSKECDN
jgi:hypothetical protein